MVGFIEKILSPEMLAELTWIVIIIALIWIVRWIVNKKKAKHLKHKS